MTAKASARIPHIAVSFLIGLGRGFESRCRRAHNVGDYVIPSPDARDAIDRGSMIVGLIDEEAPVPRGRPRKGVSGMVFYPESRHVAPKNGFLTPV